MKVELNLDSTKDRDLIIYFESVDVPAREYVTKQLLRTALETDHNPFKKMLEEKKLREKNPVPSHPVEIDGELFEYDSNPKKKKFEFAPKEDTGPLKVVKLSDEERLKKINEKLLRF